MSDTKKELTLTLGFKVVGDVAHMLCNGEVFDKIELPDLDPLKEKGLIDLQTTWEDLLK